jgi:hypothetical protein
LQLGRWGARCGSWSQLIFNSSRSPQRPSASAPSPCLAGGLRSWPGVCFARLTGPRGLLYRCCRGDKGTTAYREGSAVGRMRDVPSTTPACPGLSTGLSASLDGRLRPVLRCCVSCKAATQPGMCLRLWSVASLELHPILSRYLKFSANPGDLSAVPAEGSRYGVAGRSDARPGTALAQAQWIEPNDAYLAREFRAAGWPPVFA